MRFKKQKRHRKIVRFYKACFGFREPFKLLKVPGVPVVFGLRNALLLETPSVSQRQFVKFTEEDRSHMSELEFKMLKKIEKGMDEDENEPQNVETAMLSNVKGGGKGIEEKDKAQFKRKKPKGPNPLSCKKRRHAEAPHSGPTRVNDDSNNNMTRSRSKKKNKNKEPASTST
ncbi:rRNA-processing protein UTP23-like [Impatiens glandulifera]|uniref:rRNA-processing protein UTP23-like n=1 Tax=Impatiens glandulifera TaxID=253017 RepID=UPI001FB17D90|nr:rRNA-processing protein UTP23-like [Impatiens glandulifera]